MTTEERGHRPPCNDSPIGGCNGFYLRLVRRRYGHTAVLSVHGGYHARAEQGGERGNGGNPCELKAEGRYSGTLYTIRYFQFEGQGSLKMDNGITFLPNDRYLLENEKFRLYYTSEGEDRHDFIVVIEDNQGNSHELTFDFNNSDGDNGDMEHTENTEGGGK